MLNSADIISPANQAIANKVRNSQSIGKRKIFIMWNAKFRMCLIILFAILIHDECGNSTGFRITTLADSGDPVPVIRERTSDVLIMVHFLVIC
jgi:hypothetical protein